MSQPKGPFEQAVDLLVYAPVGLALAVRDDLAAVVEKGRSQVTRQVETARIVGELAVAQGRREVSRLLRQARENVAGMRSPAEDGSSVAPPTEGQVPEPTRAAAGAASAAPVAAAVSEPATVADADTAAPPGNGRRPDTASGATEGTASAVPSGEHLAIPGYDTLAASQVVQRLAGLTAEELDAVARYETATRGRRTILTRVAQLRTEPQD